MGKKRKQKEKEQHRPDRPPIAPVPGMEKVEPWGRRGRWPTPLPISVGDEGHAEERELAACHSLPLRAVAHPPRLHRRLMEAETEPSGRESAPRPEPRHRRIHRSWAHNHRIYRAWPRDVRIHSGRHRRARVREGGGRTCLLRAALPMDPPPCAAVGKEEGGEQATRWRGRVR